MEERKEGINKGRNEGKLEGETDIKFGNRDVMGFLLVSKRES